MTWLLHVTDKIQNAQIVRTPFPHMIIDDFLPIDSPETFYQQFVEVNYTKEKYFIADNNGEKRGFENISESESQKYVAEIFGSNDVARLLADKFSYTGPIYADPSFDRGGLTISLPNGFLRYHSDFNFSSKLNRYRVLNAIFYVNYKYNNNDGGCLHLLDNNSSTVEISVEPVFNRCVVFLTSKNTPHGVSRNSSEFTRFSFNSYFYADQPLDDAEIQPHRTIWKN